MSWNKCDEPSFQGRYGGLRTENLVGFLKIPTAKMERWSFLTYEHLRLVASILRKRPWAQTVRGTYTYLGQFGFVSDDCLVHFHIHTKLRIDNDTGSLVNIAEY